MSLIDGLGPHGAQLRRFSDATIGREPTPVPLRASRPTSRAWLSTGWPIRPTATHRHLEGTLLFVDVSGFTALTERLAARGKVGAEEITDVIGSVFTEMLGVAARYGADLLKWGGDASLLFFSEPASPIACLPSCRPHVPADEPNRSA